ncbi:type IX secretion system anionic LPS delivery protein PorZ [Hymenobacter sp. PAMC 26628]|uniref:type IX secretion system anionic LPS delivery protein PorZ n=1 Tax=Hymenobacter sp. PAMC 26628 TaxID=1484118 RepID=UPI000AED74B7|nr:T9SS type A sorting domain-containing protein [Hymenobacter sp. PAMC 26628]
MPRFARLLVVLLLLAPLLGPLGARAQNTAGYGDWQLHLPTNRPLHLADAGNRVYVGTENAFYFIDKTLNTTQTLSSRDGLSDVGVAALAYDSVGHQTVVVYRNNNVDLLGDDGQVRNLPDILRKSIQSDRTIYQAMVSGRRAYLAAAFGVVVLNLDRVEVSDTYSAIGPVGAAVRVYATAVAHDTLFAATSAGLQVARMADNLLDYRSWAVYQPVPVVAGGYEAYRQLSTQSPHVYATVDNGGGTYVFRRAANAWQPVAAPYTTRARQLRSSLRGLLLAGDNYGVYRRDAAGTFQLLSGPAGSGDYVTDAVYSARDGSYYVANYLAGVQRLRAGQAPETFAANGPATGSAYSLLSDAHTGITDVFTGGYTDRYLPFYRREGFYEYTAGQWTNINGALPAAMYPNPFDVSRGARTADGTLYVASYGNGLLEWKGPGQFRAFTEGTPGSLLRRTIDPNDPSYISVRVTDVAPDATGGVWVANQHRQAGVSGLFHFDPAAAAWSAIPYFNGSQNLDRLAIDNLGQVWASEARQGGDGLWVVDPNTSATRKFSLATDPATGSDVILPGIYDVVNDRAGAIWVTTAAGVAVLDDPSGALAGTSTFRLPAVQRGEGSRFPVLYSEVVKSVAVDGANRKWFGTDNGLWLFSADGSEALLHFTTANSPLPTNRINDVAVNDKTGEVWVATDSGVLAYRGGATVTEGTPSCAQVFPNPVRPDFAGLVGIGGLANNALVKITDVAGHLVYATTATGGTVTWNLTDSDGRRVRSGVYLVLTSDANGQNGCVSKVAVLSK